MDALVQRLRAHGKSGVYRSVDPPQQLASGAQAAALALFRVDASALHTKVALLGSVAGALSFPAWAGRNWDALEDCLTDLSWIDAAGIVIEFAGIDAYAQADPQGLAVLVDIFKTAAEYWRGQRKAFWVIFTGNAAARLEIPDFLP